MGKLVVPRMEIHASHACNLTCESCSHLSNHAQSGMISPEEAERQMAHWSPRLQPNLFVVCGGEPTLNPRLPEIVEAAARHFFSVDVSSNGFFLERHPDLPRALKKVRRRGRLVLSQHGTDPEYVERFSRAVALAEEWKRSYGIYLTIRGPSTRWTRRYEGYGPTMRPYADGDRRRSWEICQARYCMQIHSDRLWKCPIAAYMRMHVEKFPELREPYAPMVAYDGLASSATDEELAAFVKREDEAMCGLCPATPREFAVPSPLIPARELLRRARESLDS